MFTNVYGICTNGNNINCYEDADDEENDNDNNNSNNLNTQ